MSAIHPLQTTTFPELRLTILAKYLSQASLHYSYRFLFIPSTIGSITWLSLNESRVSNIKHGLVVACVGDSGKLTYKKTRRGDTEIDKAFLHALKDSGKDYEILDFSPYGYDERQFCSPRFNLPVGVYRGLHTVVILSITLPRITWILSDRKALLIPCFSLLR
jgi:aminopeptidase-like protein